MSSAEDKTSSTLLPPQGTSNSAPEEFPVDAMQEHANALSSSAASTGEPNQVDLKAEASPEQAPPNQSLEEPGDDTGIPLKTKPLPKVNAAAREIRVRVTGARVGSVPGERELFSELTTSVLVFERGGVIRLTAAVAPGQLLFLSNEDSKREVVAQVMRKRAYRPTECYVEFEFTEPTPGFWGMEFPAATALLPQDANVIAATEMISSAETTEDELVEAARPDSSEIEALKKEVEALRSQLSQLQAQPESAPAQPAGAIPATPPSSPADTLVSQTLKADAPNYQTEKAPWTELSADVAPMEGAPKPSRVSSPDQDLQSKADLLLKPGLQPKPALVFRKSMLPPKRSARGQFTPGFRAGMLRLAVLSGVLAALIGFGWYKHWFPWMHQPTKFSVSTFAGGVTTKVATPKPAGLPTEAAKASAATNEPISAKATTLGTGSLNETPSNVATGKETEMAPYEVVRKPVTREKSKPPVSIANAKPSRVQPLPAKMVTPFPAAGNTNMVPPKLIKSEPAVATLEDLRDFETGSVLIDAFIDTDGSVGSMTVLSGPPSLRQPALRALRNYKYEPATQNGHAIAAHVTVKIQFHFE